MIPRPEDIPFFPIPETDELRKIWLTTIIIGLCLTIVGLVLRPYLKKVNRPTKPSTILIVAGVIVIAYAAPNCPKATGIACPQTAGYNVWENCLGRRKTPGIGSRGPKTHHGHCIMLHEHMG